MAQKETVKQFSKNWNKFDDLVESALLSDWNKETVEVLNVSSKKVPVRIGDLQGSGKSIFAKITSKGIESSVKYTAPYAMAIEEGIIKGTKIKLRPVGHSFRADGTQSKRVKGQTHFLRDAVKEGESEFIKITSDAVSKGWRQI